MAGEVETKLIELASGRRHGALRRDELIAAGISRSMIAARLDARFLVERHRGVYVLSTPHASPLALESAALLACRPRAVLDDRTAGRLLGLPVNSERSIHVSVVGRRRANLRGVRVRSIERLGPSELRRLQGLPVVSPALALLSIARHGDANELLGCLHEARVKRLVSDDELRAVLANHPNRAGARNLARLLNAERGPRMTRTKAERRTLRLLRANDLEPDHSEYEIGPYTLDFYFEAERVAVEYDSQTFHDNPRRFVRDRRRIAYLAACGILTFPLTAADLGSNAARAMRDLRATLDSRG